MASAEAAAPPVCENGKRALTKPDEKKIQEEKKARMTKIRKLLVVIGTLSFFAGVASLFYYPQYFANRTYMSENALSPHWDNLKYNREDAAFVVSFVKQYEQFQQSLSHDIRSKDSRWNNATAQWLVSRLRDLGIDASAHSFEAPRKAPLRIGLSDSNPTAWNVQAVLRAPRAPGGQDATLLTARFPRTVSAGSYSAHSLGFVVSLMKSLEGLKWRSRDIVMVLSADIYDGAGLSAWLQDYFTLDSAFKGSQHGGIQQHYTTIFGALNFDVTANLFSSIGIRAEGSYGNLPNLDLVNTIVRVSARASTEGRQLNLALSESIFPRNVTISIPFTSEARTIRPSEVIPMFRENEQLFTFIANQASGVPNGDHAYMLRYAINSVTLYTPGLVSIKVPGTVSLVELGRTVEGTIRSLHNLIEPLHQSFFFYLLPSPWTYVSIGQYMISLGLLVTGFTLHPALILLGVVEKIDSLYAAVHLVVALAVGILSFALPLYVPTIAEQLGFQRDLIALGLQDILAPVVWIAITAVGEGLVRVVVFPRLDLILRRQGRFDAEWHKARDDALSAISVVPIFVSIPVLALVNFSFAVLATLVAVPLSTLLVRSVSSNAILGRVVRSAVLLAFSSVGFMYLVANILSEYSLLDLVEQVMTNYSVHGSFLYPFLCLAWTPFVIIGQKRLLGM